VSFRSSVPARLRDQQPETGSIPGSSTEKVLVRANKNTRPRGDVKIPDFGAPTPLKVLDRQRGAQALGQLAERLRTAQARTADNRRVPDRD
jgi:hypothetical protein